MSKTRKEYIEEEIQAILPINDTSQPGRATGYSTRHSSFGEDISLLLENFPKDLIVVCESRTDLPATAGVYICDKAFEGALYVGQSKNIKERWASHHLKRQLESKNFVVVCFLTDECKGLKHRRIEVEAFLIDLLKPRFNTVVSKDLAGKHIVQCASIHSILDKASEARKLGINLRRAGAQQLSLFTPAA